MFGFFKKLLMSRQMSFEQGKIRIADEISIMVHGPAFIKIDDMIMNQMGKPGIRTLYLAAKDGGIRLGKAFEKKFGVTQRKLATLLKDLAEMGGWGIIEFQKFSPETKTVLIKVEGSPFAELTEIKGKKVCHMTRGLLAGGITTALGEDYDGIEICCKNENKKFCQFLIQPKGMLEDKKLVSEQL